MVTLVFTVVVALGMALFELWRSDRSDQLVVQQHFQQIEDSFAISLADALWNYNGEALQLIGEGIVRQSDVSRVLVFEDGNSVVDLGGDRPGAVSRDYPLHRGPVKLGRLVVSIDREALRSKTMGRFSESLLSSIFLTLCIAGFVLVLLERRVMRFVRHAAKFVVNRNSSNLSDPLVLRRRKYFKGHDELDLLTEGLTGMQQELASAIGTLVKDIQRREAMENALSKSEARFRQMFDGNVSVLLLIEPNGGRIVDANAAAATFYGYTINELRSMDMDQINVGPPDETAVARSSAVAREGSHFVFPHRLANGSVRTVEVRVTPIEVEDRVLLFSIIQDVTEIQISQDALLQSETRLSAVFHGSPIGISVSRMADEMILDVNESAQAILGCRRLGESWGSLAELGTRLHAGQWREAQRQVSSNGSVKGFPIDILKNTGERGVVEYSGSRIVFKRELCVVSMWMDVTERNRTEDMLRKLSMAVEQSPVSIVITNTLAEIEYVNMAFIKNSGYQLVEVIGKNPRMLQSGATRPEIFASLWETLLDGKTWKGELFNRRKDGSEYIESSVIAPILQPDGQVTNYVAVNDDITVRKESEEKIHKLAFYDPLTGLPNRRLLIERLHLAKASCVRSGTTGALLFIDLDNFKTLNDSLGHEIGDLLLQQVALRLVGCVRLDDSVARLGGDEFVVMLECLGETSHEATVQAKMVGDKVLSALRQVYQLSNYAHHSTPSIGIALFSDGDETVDDLLRHADLAMYQSKASGRNTLRFFDPEMQAVVATRAAMEDDLRVAIQQGQFQLHYQAQVVGDGRVTGAEVLLRWQHPERGTIAPAMFIPLAEDTGLILALGNWVLHTACTQLAVWAGEPETDRLTIAVNVSSRQFGQATFVDEVLTVIARTGANPHRLKLELTESLLVENVEDVIAKMAALKAKGIGFSLDDFGTGYSSLSYLKRLPLDQLKIDQGFVRDILTDPNDSAIAKMVIALAESMGLTVIAEGVEIEAQRDYLARLGCHAYQGYLFSRPLSLQAFEAFLMARVIPKTEN